MKIGDSVKILFGKYYGRKALIIDIDYLSTMGSYPDRYTVKMCKSKEEFDCTKNAFCKW